MKKVTLPFQYFSYRGKYSQSRTLVQYTKARQKNLFSGRCQSHQPQHPAAGRIFCNVCHKPEHT